MVEEEDERKKKKKEKKGTKFAIGKIGYVHTCASLRVALFFISCPGVI